MMLRTQETLDSEIIVDSFAGGAGMVLAGLQAFFKGKGRGAC